jgi:mRNA-degrading endonuclease RelE of RelBE toxin-antitoxin system
MWDLRYAPTAVTGIYKVPRGSAALVTEAIKQLRANPRPANAEPVPERNNTHRIEVEGYSVVYEVLDDQRQVVILRVE